MKQSESIKIILEAMARAQAEFPTLPKDKNGYNYKYTDLETVISTLRPILARHGLGFMQSLTTLESGRWAITTRIFNANGEWLEDTTPLPDVSLAKGNAAQNVGAAITYMKRYSLCAMLGIASDEDPDGKPDGNADFNARGQHPTAPQRPQPPKQNAPQLKGGPDTPQQKERINTLLGSVTAENTRIFSKAECAGIGKMRMTKTADEVIKYLESELARRNPTPENFPEDLPFDNDQPMTQADQEAMEAIF